MNNTNFIVCIPLILFLICMGCYVPTKVKETHKTYDFEGETPEVGLIHPIGLEEEKFIGKSLAIQVLNKYGGLYDNPDLQRYITLVGRSLADVSDRPELDYHFAVVNSELLNACATPGGYVFVSLGLLRRLENEAQLAGVLGHEIAHITHRHALRTLERNKKIAELGFLSVRGFRQRPDVFHKVIEHATEMIFTYGLDLKLEFEADKMGTEYIERLGYNSEGLKTFLEIFEETPSEKDPMFINTHPTLRDRLNQLAESATDSSEVSKPLFAAEYKKAVQGKI